MISITQSSDGEDCISARRFSGIIGRIVIGYRRSAVLGCLLLGSALLLSQDIPPQERILPDTTAPQSTATNPRASATATSLSGAALSRAYCQSCHWYPEPTLIDRETWSKGTLPYMSNWLGVGKFDHSRRADAQLLERPIPPLEHWQLINRYYLENAPATPPPQPPHPQTRLSLPGFTAKPLFLRPALSRTSLLKIDPARRALWIGDANAHTLERANAAGQVEQRFILPSDPVRVSFHGSELYLTLIGRLLPSDELAGSVGWFSPDTGRFTAQLQNLRRPAAALEADLNGDGQKDVIVCQFGNRLGRLSWFEKLGEGRFAEHALLERPGAVQAYVVDANADGRPDVLALTAQGREGVYLLQNDGGGRFRERAVIQQHPAFGYSQLELIDFNRDGHLDLLTVNGDSGDYPSGPRAFHGVRLYLNDGWFNYREAWFHPMNGAYQAVVADFDGDGDLDVAAISFFPDYQNAPNDSFLLLENLGDLKFQPWSLPEANDGRWLRMDAGDLDGDGDIDLALGSFLPGPETISIPAALWTRWQTNRVSVLLLLNTRRDKTAAP